MKARPLGSTGVKNPDESEGKGSTFEVRFQELQGSNCFLPILVLLKILALLVSSWRWGGHAFLSSFT